MIIGIALHDLHSFRVYTRNKTRRRLRGAFGIDSASFRARPGWLEDYEASQKAFRSCRVNVDGFPNVANGSRWFAEDPETFPN